MNRKERKPEWLITKGVLDSSVIQMEKKLSSTGIKTVCREAACPNRCECWKHKSFTFILLGNDCTRNCPFCNIDYVKPLPVDESEPEKIAGFVKEMDINHIVLTSVTRDDIPDGGASQFIRTIREIRKIKKDIPIELLIPDFGDFGNYVEVIKENPSIIGHNIETVRRLYPAVRPRFKYDRCLEIISFLKSNSSGIYIKSAILAGLGESAVEIKSAMSDLAQAGCDIIYAGQYLAPSMKHYPVDRYYTPDEFADLQDYGKSLGIKSVVCAPLVRSSYRSWENL